MGADPPSRDDDGVFPSVGEVVGRRYEIVRLVGEGGFARVYEARDKKAGGRVALKVLDAEKSLDAQFAKRFEQEIRIVRELRHPNTIKIWDVGVTEHGLLYAVMELAEGVSLAEVIDETGPLPPKRATRIAEQILKALAEAHERGIVHRDLKPENILLCDVAGQSDFVKILDFGIAKSLVEDLSMVKTQTGTVMGTPGYAAPEVLMGFDATPAADVYAVGLILAEMLTGKPVVVGDSVAEILLAQVTLHPDMVASDFTAKGFRDVVRRALAAEPEARYRNTAEMLAALRESGDLEAVPSGGRAAERAPADSEDEDELVLSDTLVSIQVLPATESMPAEEVPEGRSDAGAAAETKAPEQAMGTAGVRWTVWTALALLLLAAAALIVFLVGDRGSSTDDGASAVQSEPAPAIEEEPATPVEPPVEVASAAAPELTPLPALPGPSAERLSWDWLADVGGGEVDVVSALSRPVEVEEPSSPPPESGTPRRLIAESARLNDQAVEMLQEALRNGRIEAERLDASRAQLVELTDRLINQLVEAKMCAAARSRLQRAEENRDLMDESAGERLEAAARAVAECDQREWVAGTEWDAGRFLSLIREAGVRYEMARAAEEAGEPRRDLQLRYALADYETARDMLLSALATEGLAAASSAEMHGSLRWLDARIVAILCGLDKCEAAALHLDQALGTAEGVGGDAGGGVLLTAGTNVTACMARAAVNAVGFDWPFFLELVRRGAALYDRAVQLMQPPEPPTPEVHRVRIRLTSEPAGARIRMGREVLGETPYQGFVESASDRVRLTLALDGYQDARIRVDMTGDSVERRVELEPEHPFGRVHPLGEDP